MKTDEIQNYLLSIIDENDQKLTPVSLEKAVSEKLSVRKKEIGKAIKALVSTGELAYTYQFGNSYLEKSFNHPVRVSERVVLIPRGVSFKPGPADIAILLEHGASFGTGAHPTTRLAIEMIETALDPNSFHPGEQTRLLDIGTGSGVLALVGLRMGISRAIGMDIDPCARKEAMDNACLNRFSERFAITEESLENLQPFFTLITANLRYPTLMNISSQLSRLTGMGACVVMSGFRPHEFVHILAEYNAKGFVLAGKSVEKNWGGALFIRK